MKYSLLSSLVLGVLLLLNATFVRAGAGNDNPTGPAGIFNGNVTTGCSYDAYTGNASRAINDITVAGAVGAYPLQWARTMNSRGSDLHDLGGSGGWFHSYGWRCVAPPGPSGTPAQYSVTYPDGTIVTFTYGASGYVPPPGVGDSFQGAMSDGDCYLFLADGGKVHFYQTHQNIADPGDPPLYAFDFTPGPDKITDPYGLDTTLAYDGLGRLHTVTEPAGRYLDIEYGSNGYISSVTAKYPGGPAGGTQGVNYAYGAFNSYTVLTTATYTDYSSSYADLAIYTYQVSNIAAGGIPLVSTCQDTRYPGPMKKIKYAYLPGSSGGVYGQLLQEMAYGTGFAVSALDTTGSIHTETRGDGAVRKFTYGALVNGVIKPFVLASYTNFYIAASDKKTCTLTYDSNGFVASKTDFTGHKTTYTHGPNGALTSISLPTDAITPLASKHYYYTDASCYYLDHYTDERGKTTQYIRNPDNTIQEIDYPDGGVEQFVYNAYNQVTSHTLPSNLATGTTGGTETFTIPTRGLVKTYTPPAGTGDTITYAYDINDHVQTVTDSLAHWTSYGYNQIGQVTLVTHDDNDQSVEGYAYSPDGTLQYKNIQFGPGITDYARTDYTYDDYKRLTSVTTPAHSGDSADRTTSYGYSSADTLTPDYTHTDSNVHRTVLPLGHVIKDIYDLNYHRLTHIVGYLSGQAATTTYTYDAIGNVLSVALPQNPSLPAVNVYDARNRLYTSTDPLQHSTNYRYDLSSNPSTITRPNGQVTTFNSYDSMNRLLQTTVQQAPNPAAVTKYTYTKAGKIDTMIDPKLNVYNYDYDQRNRLTTLHFPPDSGGTARTEQYAYDTVGNLHTFTNRSGAVETLGYDARNRLTSDVWASHNPQDKTLIYDDASRITNCSTTNTFINFTYFDDGLLKSQEEWGTGNYGDGTHHSVTLTYDLNGNRSTMGGMLGLDYFYTPRDQLQEVADSALSNIVSYTYDLNGNWKTRTPGTNPASSYAFNALNEVTQINHNFSNGDTYTLNYGYDSVGNRSYVQRVVNGVGTGSDGFQYDQNDQLITFNWKGTLSGGVVNGGTESDYTLDAAGNRTQVATTGQATTNYTPNALNEYSSIGGATVTNGTNGNVTAYSGASYVYDAANRITQVTANGNTSNFYYDGMNRQVARTESGTPIYTVWDGSNRLVELGTGGALVNRYIYAGNDLVRSPMPQQIYYYPDANGNTVYLANNIGALLERYLYDAFGEPTFYNSSGTQLGASSYGVSMLFGGQKYYAGVDIYDLRARAYAASMGRFLQPDPVGFAGDPANIYRYCGNNPGTLVDPSGNYAVPSPWGPPYVGFVVPSDFNPVPGIHFPKLLWKRLAMWW